MNFSRRGTPGTDDADIITAFGKTYDEQTACKIMANQQLTFFLRGVIRIVENTGERIGPRTRLRACEGSWLPCVNPIRIARSRPPTPAAPLIGQLALRHAPAQVVQKVDAGDQAEEFFAVHHDCDAAVFVERQQVFNR